MPNDAELYPSRELQRPGPIVTQNGTKEWEIDRILDMRTRGRGHQYLIRWKGYGPEADVWVPGKELENTDVLNEYNNAANTHRDISQPVEEDSHRAISDPVEEDSHLAILSEENKPHDAQTSD